MLTFKQYIEEAFDKPYPFKMEYDSGWDRFIATARLDDGSKFVMTIQEMGGVWDVEFTRGGKMVVTGEGDQMRVFATAIAVLKDFIKKESPNEIAFGAEKAQGNKKDISSREKLYSRMIKKFASKMGYDSSERSLRQSTVYTLKKKG